MKSNSTVEHLVFFSVCVFVIAAFIVSFPAESSARISGLLFRKSLS